MEKPLSPPPPHYDPFRPRDSYIARVVNTASLEKPDPFAGCTNGSERLQRLLDNAESELVGNFLLSRL
jgi:hypothetical protein